MVAPRSLEPLVLYLAATPHSASTVLVAVREERQVKSLPRSIAPSAGARRHQDGATRAATTPAKDQGPQGGALGPAEVQMGDQAPEVPPP